jgi:hypothetical protein
MGKHLILAIGGPRSLVRFELVAHLVRDAPVAVAMKVAKISRHSMVPQGGRRHNSGKPRKDDPRDYYLTDVSSKNGISSFRGLR